MQLSGILPTRPSGGVEGGGKLQTVTVEGVERDGTVRINVGGEMLRAVTDLMLNPGDTLRGVLTTKDGVLHLRVPNTVEQQTLNTLVQLAKELGVKMTPQLEQLFQKLAGEGQTLSARQLTSIVPLLTMGDGVEAETITQMVRHQLPLTEGVKDAVRALIDVPQLKVPLETLVKNGALPAPLLAKFSPSEFLSLLQTQGTNADGAVQSGTTSVLTGNMQPATNPNASVVAAPLGQVADEVSELPQAQRHVQSQSGAPISSAVDASAKTIVDAFFKGDTARVADTLRHLPERVRTEVQQLLGTLTQDAPETVREAVVAKLTQLMGNQTAVTQQSSAEPPLSRLFQALGIHTERQLSEGKAPNADQGLKQHLLSVANDDTRPPDVRQAAKLASDHLTGQQLLNTPERGDFMLSVPLYMNGQLRDATFQFSGGRDADGQFDSDHCRIAFFLSLETLGDTRVYVNVQKRVVNVVVDNGEPHGALLIEPFVPVLREALEGAGYQLTDVRWQTRTPERPSVRAWMDARQTAREGKDGIDFVV
ncbi:MAG: hypothetical protein ACRC5C_07925 [Bacilli bacterium]